MNASNAVAVLRRCVAAGAMGAASHRWVVTATPGLVVRGRSCCAVVLSGIVAVGFGSGLPSVYSQGPGTLPPAGLLQNAEPWPDQLEGIRPDAFLFQDESNTPVVMPRMSFEEIDRLRKLDRGGRAGGQMATLERLLITGTMGETRAQWNAELAVRLDGAAVRETVGRSVVVDIGFAGSHLLSEAIVRFAPRPDTDRDEAVKNESDPNVINRQAADRGEGVAGAYVRLTPQENVGQIRAGGPSNPTGDASSTTAMNDPPADMSALPATFPNVLRQAMGAEGGAMMRSDPGYQLVLPVESLLKELLTPRSSMVVTVQIPLSARVWTTPLGQSWLPLRLPAVSTLVQMDLGDSGVGREAALLDVVGSGREVARRIDGLDRYAVECDGGTIALRVTGAAEALGDTGDLLEVESETQLLWESPTEPPTMDVRLVTKNLRGPLHGCEIRLPASAVLISPPEIVASTSDSRESSGVTGGTPESAWWEVVIARGDEDEPVRDEVAPSADAEESGALADQDATRIVVRWIGTDQMQAPSSVRLRLQVRQFPPDATATDPWLLQIPQVAGAIGHRGQVTIRTAGDHRLRWRPRMGVDAVVAAKSDTGNGDLVYPFRFTQTRFELPIWLSRKQQQIRLAADAKLSVTRRAARIEIDVRGGGVGIDPKGLRLELGSWQLVGIKTEIPDSEVDISTTEGNVEWQVDTADGKWPVSFQITAELTTKTADKFESLTLPRLISTDSGSVLGDVRLSLEDDRREAWLVDLAGSPALQRIPGQGESKFRFLIPESPWSLNGSFATRPLELQWSGDVTAAQSSDHWMITSQWTITSPLDLEGRLKFSVSTLGNRYRDADPSGGAASSASTTTAVAGKSLAPDAATATTGEPAADLTPPPERLRTPRRWTALVDGNPATVRGPLVELLSDSEFADNEVYEIISPNLTSGSQRIELVLEQPILPTSATPVAGPSGAVSIEQGEINGLFAVPVPVADRIELPAPVTIQMPLGVVDAAGVFWRVLPDMDGSLGDYAVAGGFEQSSTPSGAEASATDPAITSDWTFKVIPDFPIPIVLRSRLGEEKLTEIPRAFLRSLVGKQFRHEHLTATVRGGRRVRLGLPVSLQTIRVEVLLDGRPTASTRDASGLRIDLPDASESAHALDVRIWVEDLNNPWWARTEPLIRLPVGSGLQYWQLVVPTDSHLFWASNQSGRAMRWNRDGLNLSRVPTSNDSALTRWALDLDWNFGDSTAALTPLEGPSAAPSAPVTGSPTSVSLGGNVAFAESNRIPDAVLRAAMRESLANATFAVPGNRYLFFAGNVLSFAAITVSRTVLWLAVGSLVLMLAAALQWFPSMHHSFVAFTLAVALAGLLVIAPDGIVLTAQLVMISLTLVAVFYAISAVALPHGGQRALPRSTSRDSVVSRQGNSKRERERVVPTQAVQSKPTPPQSLRDASDDHAETREVDVARDRPDADMSPMPSTKLADQVVGSVLADDSNVRESTAPVDDSVVMDSHSDSDSSEALR